MDILFVKWYNLFMQIYLVKDLAGKGKAGEIINVNDGYGRNFVIKNGFGKVVDATILTAVHAKKESANFHREEDIKATKAIIERLAGVVIEIRVKVGDNGKLFGAVTGAEIVSKLREKGFEIDKKSLVFDQIKSIGTYDIKVKFNYMLAGQFRAEIRGL